MILRRRYMEPAGFKGNSRFCDASTSNFYYKQFPRAHAVICVSNLCPWVISLFRLNATQWRGFQRGNLKLIPPGCCNAAGGWTLERSEILHQGEPVDHKTTIKLVESLATKHKLNDVRIRNQQYGDRAPRSRSRHSGRLGSRKASLTKALVR